MNLKNLKKGLERAERYLIIVRKFQIKDATNEEFEYLQASAGILQKEMQKLGHGIIFLRRPFNLGIFPNFQIIANFPIMISTRGLVDEGYGMIPTVKQALLSYIQEVKELLENPEDSREVIETILEKNTERKDVIIKSLQGLKNEIKSFGTGIDRIVWLKRIISFIRNELPSSKRYKDIEFLFDQFLEGFPKLYTAENVDYNSEKIIDNLISFITEDNFETLIVNLHEKISEVSLELFKNGHYTQAIFESVKTLNNYIKEKANIQDKDLSDAMAHAFNERNPLIKLNDLETRSEKDEQEGFKLIYMGVMKGIRNPKAHENVIQNDKNRTIEYLAFISLLFRRAEEGSL